MSKEKLGTEPAFPKPFVNDPHWEIAHTPGMSKRFYAACSAMQGLLARYGNDGFDSDMQIVSQSYDLADELLKQEKEHEQTKD